MVSLLTVFLGRLIRPQSPETGSVLFEVKVIGTAAVPTARMLPLGLLALSGPLKPLPGVNFTTTPGSMIRRARMLITSVIMYGLSARFQVVS